MERHGRGRRGAKRWQGPGSLAEEQCIEVEQHDGRGAHVQDSRFSSHALWHLGAHNVQEAGDGESRRRAGGGMNCSVGPECIRTWEGA